MYAFVGEQVKVLELLKQDSFGRVELVGIGQTLAVRRVAAGGRIPGSAFLARFFARREAKILSHLQHIPDLPRMLGEQDGKFFYRSYLPGQQLDRVKEISANYFVQLFALLQVMHAAGVVHNDLAKEANIMMSPAAKPFFVDFQLACIFPRKMGFLRRAIFDMLCREDRRHLLKQKARHRADLLVPQEWQALKQKSWPARIWWWSGMRLYHAVTRPLGWRDNEGL